MKYYPFGIEDLYGEEWRDIEGYEGHYQISNYGRMKSFFNGKFFIVKPKIDIYGYFETLLFTNCVKKKFKAHKLVAKAFIPNLENKDTVNYQKRFS